MRPLISLVLSITLAILAAGPVQAADDEQRFSFGGDQFAGGEHVIVDGADNDVFAGGRTVNITGAVGGDVHAMGYSVSVDADVSGNIYGAGNSVAVTGRVGKDVTAGGKLVTIGGPGVGGNVRAGGATVTINAPVGGSVMTAAEQATLNAPISGDFRFTGDRLTFGGNARVDGTVHIRAHREIEVPASVAPAERVTVEVTDDTGMMSDAGRVAQDSMRGFGPLIFHGLGFAIVIFVIGAIWLALARQRSEIGYLVARLKPFKSFGFGFLSLAMFIGLIFVSGLTLIGLPLIPVFVLILVVVWITGSFAGAYFLARWVLTAFGRGFDDPGWRILALAVGIAFAWLIGFVPILGWLVQLALVLYGLGGLSLAALHRGMDTMLFHDVKDQAAA